MVLAVVVLVACGDSGGSGGNSSAFENWMNENNDELLSIGTEQGIYGAIGSSDNLEGVRIESGRNDEIIFIFYGANEAIQDWMSREWFTMEATFSSRYS